MLDLQHAKLVFPSCLLLALPRVNQLRLKELRAVKDRGSKRQSGTVQDRKEGETLSELVNNSAQGVCL